IPMLAIETMALIPGSNPLFGLNTLGGAIAIQTKSGLTSPGTELALSAGSFGRRMFDAAYGARMGDTHVFAAITGLGEDGWSDNQRLSALVYHRGNKTRTLNGDVSDAFDAPPDPPAVENRTETKQHSEGLALQWSRTSARMNFAAGASLDRARSQFSQTQATG